MRETLLDIVEGYDGKDRWYLEAIGTSVALEEAQAYAYLKSKRRGGDPSDWDAKFANIAWALASRVRCERHEGLRHGYVKAYRLSS